MSQSYCPTPIESSKLITMAHGAGGRLSDKLLEEVFFPHFNNEKLSALHDGAFLGHSPYEPVMSTDTFVIKPFIFHGGDIGELCVYGTTNDLVMCGATPRYLSCGFILSEGLPISLLEQVVQSMAKAAKACEVQIITGDTKVIDKSNEPELMINTTGIGYLEGPSLKPSHIAPGDAIIVSGDIGRHGLALLAQRNDLQFEPPLVSDCASLLPSYQAIKDYSVHCMRDCTRGGLAASLIELALASKYDFLIEQNAIPVSGPVQSACDLLGLNPIHAACEGRFVLFAPVVHAASIIQKLKTMLSVQACQIGLVTPKRHGEVLLKTPYGALQKLRKTTADQLPRIC